MEVLWKDAALTRIRFQEAGDDAISYVPQWLYDGIAQAHRSNAARLGIISSDPAMLGEFPADRVATDSLARGLATREISEIVTGMDINWCLVGAASPAWASRIFPDDSPEAATAKLWDKIFLTSRVLQPDPIGAWSDHCRGLEARVDRLNELRLSALHFVGPGTDLTVGLVEDHLWAGGRGVAKSGIRCSPNIPTEEVFTMPHCDRVDGFVTSTKPLSLRGQVLDGIRVEFREGVAVSATAATGQEALQKLLASDEGAKRLGEVALVPNSSKVAETGILFLNSLYDENAASHIALGASYTENLRGIEAMDEAERRRRGCNSSVIHVDWMIGSDRVDVDGIRADGSVLPLMRSGEWV